MGDGGRQQAGDPESWLRVVPPSFRLAHLLLGDTTAAARVARRTFVRLRVGGRRLLRAEELDVWVVRTALRLSARTSLRSRLIRRPLAPEGVLGQLSLRKRSAFLVSTFLGLDTQAGARVLDRSTGGFEALVHSARAALEDDVPTSENLAASVADLEVPQFTSDIQRRVATSRWLGVTVVIALLSAAAWGAVNLGRTPSRDADRSSAVAPGPQGPADARADLARFGAPGWCPQAERLGGLADESVGGAADAAMRFDIALAKGGYERTLKALTFRSASAPGVDVWPHHESSGGLAVIQVSMGSSDPDLVRSCGREVADRSIKVGILQRAQSHLGRAVAFYAAKLGPRWVVWGSAAE